MLKHVIHVAHGQLGYDVARVAVLFAEIVRLLM